MFMDQMYVVIITKLLSTYLDIVFEVYLYLLILLSLRFSLKHLDSNSEISFW